MTDIGRTLQDLQNRISKLERSSRLSSASLDDTAMVVRDGDGSLRAIVGQQVDGTTAVVAVNGPIPPTPTPPAVTPTLKGLRITWDGSFADALVGPLDLARVQVHLLPDAVTLPDVQNPTATIEPASGASVTIAVPSYAGLWVRLVAVTTSGTPGTASTPVLAVPSQTDSADLHDRAVQEGHIAVAAIVTEHLSVGSVTPDQIAVGQGNNLIPDAGFESAATANAIARAGAPWTLAPGNRYGVGVRADCTATVPTDYTLPLATVPVLAADQMYLGVDVLVSADYAGVSVRLFSRWEDSAGTVLGFGVAETLAPVAGEWQPLSGQAAAPQGTTQAVLCLEVQDATAGFVVFDNAEAHKIFGRAVGGARAELGPQGLRLFDDGGDEAVSLVTGQPNYITFRENGIPVAAVGSTGDGSFQNLAVGGALSLAGEEIRLEDLRDTGPRGIIALDWQSSGVSTPTGVEKGFVELAFTAEEGRMYRIRYDGNVECSATGGVLALRLRNGFTNAPLVSSASFQEARHPLSTTQRQRVWIENVSGVFPTGFVRPGLNRLLLTYTSEGGAPAGSTVTLTGATSYLGHLLVEDIGQQIPETGIYNTGGAVVAVPPVKTTKVYNAAWSGSYAARNKYNSYYGNQLVGGYYSANNGIQAGLVGFSSALATDLTGATLLKVEVYLYAAHWYYAAGGTATIKAHTHASRPAVFSADQTEWLNVSNWARAAGKWVDISTIFDSTTFRGIAIDPNTTNRTYYGRFDGVGHPRPPKLRVTYIK
ncbi:hypothetical protein [Streptomyces sp. NPDC058657]|uniref:hypothetical protein n=1 Tax=unclassified Streptomyces TaxID=2593676 RepID=UPI0036569748